jgi:flagellum-specific peptidoglycan hydrolase FlgJ
MKTLYLLMFPIISIGQTVEEVREELIEQRVDHYEIVLAQSILETGWYKCEGCSMDKNNLFGLWNHKKQEYYEYTSWQESVGGYIRGIQYKYDETKYSDYYEFLTSIGYASDPSYINKLKKITEKLKN